MQLIKVAAAAVNQTPLAWNGNAANIVTAIESAREQGASILCLPELCITGYGCEDAFYGSHMHEMSASILGDIVPETRGMIVSIGLPRPHSGALYNTACLVADGHIVGFAAKQNLAGEGIHYEPRWFKPWPAGVQAETVIDGKHYPLGDLVFNCGGIMIGFEICEDAWVAERPGRDLASAGADILLNPSASHFAFGKQEIRRRFVLDGSRAFGVSYVYANLLGNEAGRAIYDGGTLIASGGKMLSEGRRFSFADVELTTAVIDVDGTRGRRSQISSYQPDVAQVATGVVHCDFTFPPATPESDNDTEEAWETSARLKEEECTRAVALGLFDYLRKSRSRGFIVSLSGGADSSSVATLISLAVRLGIAELGSEGFKNKLAYIASLDDCEEEKQFVSHLLTCVYQSTRNSGETTRTAAETLSRALGAEYLEFDVDALVEGYTDMVATAIGRQLAWEEDDIALQNIQARARAPGIWMLANLRGALLLSTSNRSEAAVGYATMDGDTSGGLAPIAGIDKAFLRSWLLWMEKEGPAGLGPIPALALVNEQQPTAELRPPSSGQTDEADLMPYELLDAIERAAIGAKQMPLDVYRLMQVQFPQYDAAQLAEWVERFFRLWTRNQWKRERYAPSFHLDDQNLDPKTWCRFPILSGGFDRELAELREWVAKQ
jgi:NAD+ synthase (glutamine-hydrolysing)